MSESLANLAIRRHRIGPLVWTAVPGNSAISENVYDRLRRHASGNAARYLSTVAATQDIAKCFSEQRIPGLLFKGPALAQMLYSEPTLRHVGDIDLLVEPDFLENATRALEEAGFAAKDALFTLPRSLQQTVKRTVKDYHFVNSKTHQLLELHTRLIFSKRVSAQMAKLPRGLAPKMEARGALSTPEPGPALAHYLLIHGALSGWARLKWLVDLLPLLSKMTADERRSIADYAESTRTAAAVKAGLHFFRSAFGSAELGGVEQWMDEPAGAEAVSRRLKFFARCLLVEQKGPLPLNDRIHGLTSAIFLNDRAYDMTMLLPSAAFSSGLHAAARIVARRFTPRLP